MTTMLSRLNTALSSKDVICNTIYTITTNEIVAYSICKETATFYFLEFPL